MLQIPNCSWLRAWLEVDGTVVNAPARSGSVRLNKDILSMTFKAEIKSAELDAIALSKQFLITENETCTVILEAKPANHLSVLKDGSGYSGFLVQSTAIDEAIAYYVDEATDGPAKYAAHTLEIVSSPSNVKDIDQIAISRKGQIKVSSNLFNKTIKVRMPVVYPRRVTVLNSPLEGLKVHLVGEHEQSLKYVGLQCAPISPTRPVSLRNSVRSVQLKVLEAKVEDLIQL